MTGLNDLKITITGHDKVISDKIKIPAALDVYMKYGPKRSKRAYNIPHPGDLPLDPVKRSVEFCKVIANWFEREKDWRQARVRYVGCIEKGSSYDIDRLVAAANMFDILPSSAFVALTDLKLDLKEARDKSKLIFRKLDDGPERNSVLGALGRMHKPSLTSKVLQRVEIVTNSFGAQFPGLEKGAAIAIKARNHFVHGKSEGFDYRRVESSFTFLTDLLEFVFAASDLITAGWDAQTWANAPHSAGHSFAAFRWSYKDRMDFLLRSLDGERDSN
ncbi:HEPN domain-containing protein [Paraburkholderia sediminicola]|uniref:HEPN domain-containing protein n=1 Tax=Paraburkholderia sediminicola TaxID=458836 RepID=UPI0038BDC5E3